MGCHLTFTYLIIVKVTPPTKIAFIFLYILLIFKLLQWTAIENVDIAPNVPPHFQ